MGLIYREISMLCQHPLKKDSHCTTITLRCDPERQVAVGWNCSHSMIIQQLMGYSVSEMTTYIFQLAEGQEWVVRNKAWRLSWISFIWNYRSTFILINFDLCPGKLICVGYIIGFSGLQLSVASRDPRQKIRTKVRSMCLFLWLFSCEFTLN